MKKCELFIALTMIVAGVCIFSSSQSGCGLIAPAVPTTQPVLTPAQQSQIAFAQGLAQDADLANDAFQAVAIADPALAGDALLAAKAAKLVDSAVATYVSDVEAGGVPPAELLGQIEADLAQVLSINAKSPAAATKYVTEKSNAMAVRAKLHR